MDDAKKAANEDLRQGYLKAANKYYELLQPEKAKIDAAAKYISGQKELLKNTQDFLNSLSESDKKQISHYLIHHDLYAKNSLGNTVLGRYVFKYNLKKNEGYDVVQINK